MGNFFEFVVAFSSAIGGFLFGYEIGIIDQVLQMTDFGVVYGLKEKVVTVTGINLLTGNNLTDVTFIDSPHSGDIKGNITSLFLVGCVVGAMIVSVMADYLGRKRSILVGGLLFAAGGALQAGALDYAMFIAGRVISGLGIGVLSMVVPVYISETAPTKIRGRLIAVQQLMITIGILVAAIINTGIRAAYPGLEIEWRLSLALQCVPGILLVIMMSFMPYSPRWLELRERSHEALAALARLRASDPSSPIVRQEYDEIRDGIEFEKSIGQATWSELVKPGIINRILIAFTLQVFQQWTGINVIMYYASDLFEGMGFSKDVASKQLNLVNAAINVVGTLPGMYLVERLGRRKLLLWGGFGMGTCHLLVCLFIGLSKEGSKLLAWGAVVSIYGFILFFSSTWGPVVWVYQSEIFPLRIRAKGTGVATFANWSMNAIIAKITPIIIEKVSFYFYLIFAGTGFLMGLFTAFFVPETMGKSLEEMDDLFGTVESRANVDREREAAYAKKMAVGGH